MIPYHWALIAWVPFAALCMIDRNSARGLSIAYLGALLILPAGNDFDVSGLPSLDKYNAPTLGVLIGTIFFHPRTFDRFRLGVPDLILLLIIQLRFVTEIMNDNGVWTATSRSLEFGINFIVPVFLARLHLATPTALRTFLVALVGAGVIYAPLALFEFRMSPKIHTTMYGYFQHVFFQHYRNGMWRPIVCFDHALLLGRFFAITTFLALIPMRRDLVQSLGKLGKYVWVLPMLGLLVSQSYGPYMLFVLLCAGYYIVQRRIWPGFALPAAGVIWIAGVFAGWRPLYFLANQVSSISRERADSLWYRLYALDEYATVIRTHPLFGHGGFGAGRIEDLATDSQALMRALSSGYLGWGVELLWWFVALYYVFKVMRMLPNTVLAKRAAAVGTLCALSIAISMLDKALDPMIMLLVSSFMAIYVWVGTNQQQILPEDPAEPTGLESVPPIEGPALRGGTP